MSPRVQLVADSTADLDPSWTAANDVATVPLKVIFGDETFSDSVDITPAQFYARMTSADGPPPRTSQPAPAEFEALFRKLGAEGLPIVCTTISADMSGTWQSAMAAREAVPDLDIRVVDTRTLAAGHGLVVRAAVAAVAAGSDADAVVAAIEEVKRSLRLIFTVESLEHLRRGGRIGGAQALLGSVLRIRPVLEVRQGRVETLDKVRTFGRAVDRVVAEMQRDVERWGAPVTCSIAHADRPQIISELRGRLMPLCRGEPMVSYIGPVIGCHVGPGCIGVSYHRPL